MQDEGSELEATVGRKAERRSRSRREGRHTVWFGIGMFGLVGWAVAVPALVGVALGRWADAHYTGGPSWTITGLVLGVTVGCLNAWWWVQRAGLRRGAQKEDQDE
ncbi:AtpZ/AtpI family protein [Parapusillimonas granuli]|mgnify:CR=1 FL=1|uniref:AtpZ/AtpI family protein n=1 Tax=Parapusillimonas granuli TaxID=380911 RepID=A0A853G2P7_9BURK|nr:AtpZ/AtpI family protein [Parapusillimonas granuli]MEB2401183.1 AtpZ/AtpI family protein [Alcaligenaceae bacterium]NYT49280.1 AtpZ/AtpI family protein [Parapusillimonas granuli]